MVAGSEIVSEERFSNTVVRIVVSSDEAALKGLARAATVHGAQTSAERMSDEGRLID